VDNFCRSIGGTTISNGIRIASGGGACGNGRQVSYYHLSARYVGGRRGNGDRRKGKAADGIAALQIARSDRESTAAPRGIGRNLYPVSLDADGKVEVALKAAFGEGTRWIDEAFQSPGLDPLPAS